MPRFLNPLLVLMLLTISGASSAQNYDSFRFVGDPSPMASGTVTSIEFSQDNAKLSFLNVAGLSTVYDIRFAPSNIIRESVQVFMPTTDFGNTTDSSSLQLEGLSFLTGRLVNQENENDTPPPHWFRMTLHNGTWSGVFRIADRLYSIDRIQTSNVVEVRSIQTADTSFQPTTQVKLTALIDEDYLLNAASDNTSYGQVLALESMHVMEGLISDSLGMTFSLEQLIYRKAAELNQTDNPLDFAQGAKDWLNTNATAFGITDNLATFIFRGNNTQSTATTSYTDNNFVLQGNSQSYQFESAHYFGELLGLPFEAGTLQDLKTGQSETLPAAHWSDQQISFLTTNPPPAELIRTLSYDAPIIEVTEAVVTAPIPDFLLDSESPESSSNGTGLQNDETEGTVSGGNAGGESGGGTLSPHFLLMFSGALCALRRRHCSTRRSIYRSNYHSNYHST